MGACVCVTAYNRALAKGVLDYYNATRRYGYTYAAELDRRVTHACIFKWDNFRLLTHIINNTGLRSTNSITHLSFLARWQRTANRLIKIEVSNIIVLRVDKRRIALLEKLPWPCGSLVALVGMPCIPCRYKLLNQY